jgi:hypothetical protein
MSTLKLTYIEQDEVQVRKAFDVLMVWYANDINQVLTAMSNNPIAVANKDNWQIELDKKVSQIPAWGLGFVAIKGKQCLYNNVVYNIIQGHTVDNPSFTPNVVPALYRTAPVVLPGQTYPEWNSIGLLDSENNWDTGEIVHWVGKEWKSKIMNNIYEPGTVANTIWEDISIVVPPANPCDGVAEWNGAVWATYVIGSEVKVTGAKVELYECKGTTHTWIQPAKTGNGAISWTYLQDCI